MISILTEFLQNEITDFISTTGKNVQVHVGPIIGAEGEVHLVNAAGESLLLINMINLSEEIYGTVKMQPNATSLNLKFMFSVSNNENYLEALGVLSDVIAFFTSNHTYTSANGPGIEGLRQMNFKMYNMEDKDLSGVFISMGMKKIPSVFYECRMVTIKEETVAPIAGNLSGW
ncbi:DUF4255 domain-containing protein [Flammeovirga yaeyamensis]|uniref:DUF4255 domain-containing protein n=1 Tax=Flammeovirga yaeyamensis TaxID=367791 RepID=A0AAX1NAD1_9BACT|nr:MULTISPECIES: Pvc16 family protein [Flammeovirga]ANQ52278.1 DUF4255 domain-containing protein [Flammeovirga sp. MY04]MBB3701411.1 hypothetical protein [Flammeovirga yaeyamensis]NMF38631.1 DUF4255 domain-containing protein [Flammeovirga yaeyamensis]QWG04515.1 DUF4255 domain-containing protein [Flammeovirga yaeyamensis]